MWAGQTGQIQVTGVSLYERVDRCTHCAILLTLMCLKTFLIKLCRKGQTHTKDEHYRGLRLMWSCCLAQAHLPVLLSLTFTGLRPSAGSKVPECLGSGGWRLTLTM